MACNRPRSAPLTREGPWPFPGLTPRRRSTATLIVVRESGDRLSSLPGGQWAARLTLLVQNRMIQSFENAGLAGSVRTDGAPADKRLALDIRRFDIQAPMREARVEISARLVAESSGRTVAAKIFSASQPVAEIAGGRARAGPRPGLWASLAADCRLGRRGPVNSGFDIAQLQGPSSPGLTRPSRRRGRA